MATPSTRQNILAGLFVVFALILAVTISVILSGAHRRLMRVNEYIVRFDIEQGAPGLRTGAEVTLGGQPVGWVQRIEFSPPDAAPIALDVYIAVQADVVLREDASVHLQRPLLGAMSTVNIAGVGTGPPLPDRGVIHGTVAPPAVLAQAGFGPEQVEQVRELISSASELVVRINRLAGHVEPGLEDDLEQMRAALRDVTAAVADLRHRIPEWSDRVDSILARADDATEHFTPLAEEARRTLASAEEMVRHLDAAIRENRPRIEAVIADLETGVARLSRDSIPLVEDALIAARTGIDHFENAGRMFNSLLLEQTPGVRRILANLRLAADQFRLTSVEVRRSPWRLLYQPGRRELEAELFYDAARTYAQAVSDLREASESLEAIARADAVGVVAPTVHMETVEEVQRRLLDAFLRYQDAERELLDRMIERRR